MTRTDKHKQEDQSWTRVIDGCNFELEPYVYAIKVEAVCITTGTNICISNTNNAVILGKLGIIA